MPEERLVHPFPPVFDGNSRILILGSFPSAASREVMFYYGHKRNRFWKVLSSLYGEDIPDSTEGKRAFLISHGIALWDSIGSCGITGSSDASIKDAVPNRIPELLKEAPIEKIFTNGRASHECYEKYVFPETGIHSILLPSTSPANAAWSLPMLVAAWRVIL